MPHHTTEVGTLKRFCFRHIDLHLGVIETDLIEATHEEWWEAPESADPSWSALADGELVRALRLTLPGRELVSSAGMSVTAV